MTNPYIYVLLMYYSNYLTATLSYFPFAPVNTLPSFYKSLSHFCVFFSPFLGELLGLIWALCVTTSLEPVFVSWWAQKRVHKSRQRPSFSQTKVFRGGVGSHKPAPCSWLMVEKANLVQSCYRQVRAAAMSSSLHWLFPFWMMAFTALLLSSGSCICSAISKQRSLSLRGSRTSILFRLSTQCSLILSDLSSHKFILCYCKEKLL